MKQLQGRDDRRGFTVIELIVVIAILSFCLAIALAYARNSRASVTSVAVRLNSHMAMRRAIDLLTAALLDGTEVVTPFPGSTRNSLVVKDIVNHLRIFYLERNPVADPKFPVRETFSLYSYTDTYTGRFEDKQKRLLFANIKDLSFTTVSPGLVVIHLTTIDPSGIELASLVEVALKNIGSIDG